jgi:hypothetical protein
MTDVEAEHGEIPLLRLFAALEITFAAETGSCELE